MKRLLILTVASSLVGCSLASSGSSSTPFASRGVESSTFAKTPTIVLQPASEDFYQSPLYIPGGSECHSAANVSCQQPAPNAYETGNLPLESDGYQGPWGLSTSNPAIVNATNCVKGNDYCGYPNIGVAINASMPGIATVTVTGDKGASVTLPVTVTETTLKIQMYGIPHATQILIYVNYSACASFQEPPQAFVTFPQTDDKAKYTFTITNVAVPPCSSDTFEIVVNNGLGTTLKYKISEPKSIIAGQANTLWFGISNI